MKLKDLFPDLEKVSTEEFLEKIKGSTLIDMMSELVDHYNINLRLWEILNHYGVDKVDETTEAMQVPCLLYEHGSGDVKNSAKYFSYDRETGDNSESVYCYKCQKKLTAFWFIYKYEKEYNGKNFKGILLYIKKIFKVDIPRKLILEYDPESKYSFETLECENETYSKFVEASKIRDLKITDDKEYINKLIGLLIN